MTKTQPSPDDVQIIAVDWSGARAARDQRKAIWQARVAGGRLVELENGRTRAELTDYALHCTESNVHTVIALDFAFSLPAWYMTEREWSHAFEVWHWADAQQQSDPDRWHRKLPEPFWGTGIRRKPTGAFGGSEAFRKTELDSKSPGARPFSTFQIGGNGAVGAQSMLGMVQLERLRAAGCSVWPFSEAGWPLVIEIFPRLLVRQLRPDLANTKGEELRAKLVGGLPSSFLGQTGDALISNHDAFDAAVSAWALWRDRDHLVKLGRESMEPYAREGRIWRLPSPAFP